MTRATLLAKVPDDIRGTLLLSRMYVRLTCRNWAADSARIATQIHAEARKRGGDYEAAIIHIGLQTARLNPKLDRQLHAGVLDFLEGVT